MSMSCGVGMILTDPKKDFFEVGDISPDGPAGRSGLIQKGDILKGIDKVQVGTREFTLADVKKAIVGSPGTTVVLNLQRGQDEFDVPLVRALAGPAHSHPPPLLAAGRQESCPAGLGAFPTKTTRPRHAVSGSTLASEADARTIAPGPGVRLSGGFHRVAVPYRAVMAHEITLDAGEIVEVLRKHDSGWWEGRVVGAGVERKGWFPEVNVNSEVEVQHVSSRGHVAAGSGAAAASSPVKTAEKRAFRATLRDASRLLAELRQDLQRTRQKAPGGRVAAAAGLNEVDDEKLKSEARLSALAAEIASLKAANSSLSEKVLKSEREREELRETVESERKRADEAEKKRKSAVEELESIRADPELFLAGMRLPCRAVAVKPPAEDDDFDPES